MSALPATHRPTLAQLDALAGRAEAAAGVALAAALDSQVAAITRCATLADAALASARAWLATIPTSSAADAALSAVWATEDAEDAYRAATHARHLLRRHTTLLGRLDAGTSPFVLADDLAITEEAAR